MTFDDIKALFTLTLRDPGQAGRQIVAQNWPRDALWMALTLVSVLSSLIASALLHALPLPDDEAAQLLMQSPAYDAPILFAFLQWTRMVITVFVLFWVGAAFGGLGRFGDVLAVVAWVQAVSFVVIFGCGLIGVLVPVLGSLVLIGAVVWVLWAMVSLLNEAHRFDNRLKSAFVLVASFVGVSFGLSLFLGMFAAIVPGLT